MTTDKMNKFLEDIFGMNSNDLQKVPLTFLRRVIADRQSRSVEVVDHNMRLIDISELNDYEDDR